jgi:hypothetical protein
MQGQTHLDADGTSGTSTHQFGQKNSEHVEPEDIPWETSFFNDMQLDEVKTKKKGMYFHVKSNNKKKNNYLNLTKQMLS